MIEEFEAKLEYKPGNQNVVADAFSRINTSEEKINTSSLVMSDHSMQSSPIEPIPKTSKSVNYFRNQLHISCSNKDHIVGSTIFKNYHVHKIEFTSIEKLLSNLENTISTTNINAIHTTEKMFFKIKNEIKTKFPTSKFVYSPIKTVNITDRNEQLNIVEEIHK